MSNVLYVRILPRVILVLLFSFGCTINAFSSILTKKCYVFGRAWVCQSKPASTTSSTTHITVRSLELWQTLDPDSSTGSNISNKRISDDFEDVVGIVEEDSIKIKFLNQGAQENMLSQSNITTSVAQTFFGLDKKTMTDEELQVPLFTGTIILLSNLSLLFYGFYVFFSGEDPVFGGTPPV